VKLTLFSPLCLILILASSPVFAELPNPVLNTVFPPGGQAGTTLNVQISGTALDGLSQLRCVQPGIQFQKLQDDTFQVTIANTVPSGFYDVRAICGERISSPRTFFVSHRQQVVEHLPNNTVDSATNVSTNSVISGRIEKAGDTDYFRFQAVSGERIVIECWATRIDSRLQPLVELYQADQQPVRTIPHTRGEDVLIDFQVPADGSYLIQVRDVTFSGSSDHYYRLDIDKGPRVAFTMPAAITRDQPGPVTLYGWNLPSEVPSKPVSPGTSPSYDTVELDSIQLNTFSEHKPPIPQRAHEVEADRFAIPFPGSDIPITLGISEVPVVRENQTNHSPTQAFPISLPCEINGQLTVGAEEDWYILDAQGGEVIWLEAFGDRIGSPVDLDLSVMAPDGKTELAHFEDQLNNPGGSPFPSTHLDPSGMWTAPSKGSYYLVIRNMIGDLVKDPRRLYRLLVRRQEAEFALAAIASRSDVPSALNIARGGRSMLQVLAFRRRGWNGPIRIHAANLPKGIHCPDVWIGPGVTYTPLVFEAEETAPAFDGTLQLEGHIDLGSTTLQRPVRGGTMVRSGLPNGAGRLTDELAFAVAGHAPLKIIANASNPEQHPLYGNLDVNYFQGSILNVAVHVERSDPEHQADVQLTGFGLPSLVQNQQVTIPAGTNKGFISFYLPPQLAPGTYSIAIQTSTTAPIQKDSDPAQKSVSGITSFSNAITVEVLPAPFIVNVNLDAPRKIQRGTYIQVRYHVKRQNGFIGKIHTELGAPGGVQGIRARGVTFVGQTDSGVLQVIANKDAPLGRQSFLRLDAIGTIEDQPIYYGSCFLDLEIVE